MENYFVQVGEMWVTHCWEPINKVQFSTERKYIEQNLTRREVKWLMSHFDNVKVYEVNLKEVDSLEL